MHTTTNPSTSALLPLMEHAKSEVQRGRDLRAIVDDLLKNCDEKEISIAAPPAWRTVESYIAGSLRRVPLEQQLLLVGMTNSGKDTFSIRCLNQKAASALGVVQLPNGELVSVLEEEDAPDKTRAVIKIDFGDFDDGGLVLFNTPGLYADNPALENMTRSVLQLETETEVSKIGYIDAGRSPAVYESLPVGDIPINLNRAIIVFMVDLTVTPLSPKFAMELRQDLQAIRERVGNRLFVVGSFLDKLQTWSPAQQERRRNTWSDILQHEIQIVEYSGITGEGLPEIIHQLLVASNLDASYLLPYLNAERKASRLSFSLHSLASLISSTFFVDQSMPYTDLLAAITLTSAIHMTVHYSVSEEVWFAKNGNISQIVKDGMSKETVARERDPKGIWEKISRWWSGTRFHEDIQVYQISVKGLAAVLTSLYSLIHELEEVVASAMVSDTETSSWFATELEAAGVASFLSKKDPESLQRALSDTLLKFWRVHHPEALDLQSRLNL